MSDNRLQPDPEEEFQFDDGTDFELDESADLDLDDSEQFRLDAFVEIKDDENDDATVINIDCDGDSSDSIIINVDDPHNGPWAEPPAGSIQDSFGDAADIEFPVEASPVLVTWEDSEHHSDQDSAASPVLDMDTLSLNLKPVSPRAAKKRPVVLWTFIVMLLAGSLGAAWWQFGPIVKAHMKYHEGVNLAPTNPDAALACFQEALNLKRSFPAAECEIARIHIKRENWTDAIKCIMSAIEADPGFSTAYYLRGIIRFHDKDLDGAIEDFSQARNLGHDVALSLYHRGLAYQERQKPDDLQRAIDDFTGATQADPSMVEAWFQCGMLCFRLEREKEAIANFDSVLELQPKHVKAVFYRGRSWRIIGEPGNALEDISTAIELAPENAVYREERATLRTETGDFPGAIVDWESVVKVRQNAGVFIQLGLLYLKTGQPEKAQESFTSAIDLDPRSALARGQRGLLHLAADNIADAKADLDRSLELSPNQPDILHASARCEFQSGDLERAIQRCSELIRIDPESVDAYMLRGEAHVQKRDLDSAILDFTTAIDLNKDLAAAYRFRGQVFFEQGILSRAIADLSRAIEIDQDDIQSLLLRGTIYITLEKPEPAVDDFHQVILRQPEHVGALRGRARAFFLVANFKASAADFTSVLAITPGDTDALVGRFRCHEKLGQLNKAMDDLQSAIAQDPALALELKGEHASLYMQRGLQSLNDSNWDDALADFTAAERTDSNARTGAEDAMAIVYRKRAIQLLKDKGPEEALPDLYSCLKLRPDDLEARRLRADIHVQLGNHQEAIDDYSALLELEPDQEHSLLARGRSRYVLKKFKDAIADFTQVIRINPAPDIAYIERARAQMNLDLFTEAIQDYTQAVVIKPENSTIVTPELARAHQKRGEQFFGDDRFTHAVREFKQALELDKTVAPLVKDAHSLAHYELGTQGLKDEELDDAIDHFNQALEINPSMVAALVGRGRCHLQTARLDEAHADFAAAITMQPADPVVHARALLGRAQVAILQGHPDAAIDDLNVALNLDPKPADSALLTRCYITRGHIRVTRENRTLGDLEDGIKDFEIAIGLDETKEDLHRADIVRAFMDLAHMEMAHFDEQPSMPLVNSAIGHLRRVLDVDHDAAELIEAPLASAFHRRGKLFHADEDFTNAIDDFEEAIHTDPRVEEIVSPDMALAFFQRGMLKEHDSAIADFNEALRFHAALDTAFVARGRVYLELARFPAAIEDFARAVEIDRDNLPIVQDDYARAHRLRGEQYFDDHQFLDAVVDFKMALELDDALAPLVKASFSKSHYELALQGLENTRLDDAINHFDHALEVDPAMVVALVGRGNCHFQMGALDKAHADFTAAITMKPADPVVHARALLGRAQVGISLDNPDAAIDDLTTVLDLRPRPADSQLLAQCQRTRGYVLVARDNRTVEDLEAGIEDFILAIDLDQAQEDTLRVPLTQAFHDLGRMEMSQFDEKPGMPLINRVIEHFKQAVRVDPQASSLVEKPLAGAYHRRGRLYHGMEEYSKAISEFDEALRVDITIADLLAADIAQAHAQRGIAHVRRKTAKSLADGIQDLRTALEFDVDLRPIVQGPLAASLAKQAYEKLDQGSTSEAIDLLEAASDAHPDFIENRGLAKLLRHQAMVTPEQEVIEDLRGKLADIHKQRRFQINMQPVPETVRATLGRQFSHVRQFRNAGMLEKALAAMDGIIQQGWAIPFHYYYRGIILHELREPKERWKIDFETGSYLEALGLQNAEDISSFLINVQGPSRVLLQDQRELGPSILQQRRQVRQQLREIQLLAAQNETRRYEPKS
jgi:tetratricopeptide (TPR) repeat protein